MINCRAPRGAREMQAELAMGFFRKERKLLNIATRGSNGFVFWKNDVFPLKKMDKQNWILQTKFIMDYR